MWSDAAAVLEASQHFDSDGYRSYSCEIDLAGVRVQPNACFIEEMKAIRIAAQGQWATPGHVRVAGHFGDHGPGRGCDMDNGYLA